VFQKMQYRLLLSYSAVFASILMIFAVGVRIVFVQILNGTFGKLCSLARSAASDMKFVVVLKLKVIFSLQSSKKIKLQWFDLQGNIVATKGQRNKFPFSTNKSVKLRQTKGASRQYLACNR